VEPKHTKFTAEVERLVRAAEEDTAEALCRLSLAQQAFQQAAEEMRQRLGEIPEPAAPAAQSAEMARPQAAQEEGEAAVPRRMLQLFWLLLAACSMTAFAVGYWMGRFGG
jgi:hypothetical protein